jgi:ABC-type transport system involved in cytochrome c biogenesis permease subunit
MAPPSSVHALDMIVIGYDIVILHDQLDLEAVAIVGLASLVSHTASPTQSWTCNRGSPFLAGFMTFAAVVLVVLFFKLSKRFV